MIIRKIGPSYSLTLSRHEFGLFHSCLNETLNGFGLKDFPGKVGTDELVIRSLLDATGDGFEYGSGTSAGEAGFHVASASDDQFVADCNPKTLAIFKGVIHETLEELSAREFGTRVGMEAREARALEGQIAEAIIG